MTHDLQAVVALVDATPNSAEQVLQILQALDARFPPDDGIGWFNRLYLKVSEAVRNELATHPGTGFQNAAFIERLDVVFANLYLGALRKYVLGAQDTPHAWWPLFERRQDPHVRGLQFALAGMNAHINRDLAVALTITWSELGITPAFGTPEHADYEKVNAVLGRVETQVKGWYLDGTLARLDGAFGSVDDLLAVFSIRLARDAAWTFGQGLWDVRADAGRYQRKLDVLDRLIGFAGRTLLFPSRD